jgi:ADP-ribose pyrophosphatase YjhB (NUDIX family)
MMVRPVAGVLLRDAEKRVLLIRRATENTWGLPGGGLEPGESWRAAAVRECREETGWNARIDGLLGIYSDPATQVHRYPSGALRHFVGVVFLGTAAEHISGRDNEAAELRWITHDELPEQLFGPDVPVLADYFGGPQHRPHIG